jgi:hypothetical protein
MFRYVARIVKDKFHPYACHLKAIIARTIS